MLKGGKAAEICNFSAEVLKVKLSLKHDPWVACTVCHVAVRWYSSLLETGVDFSYLEKTGLT